MPVDSRCKFSAAAAVWPPCEMPQKLAVTANIHIKIYCNFEENKFLQLDRLRCEDTLSRRNPRWNVTDHLSGQTIGQVFFSFNTKMIKFKSVINPVFYVKYFAGNI